MKKKVGKKKKYSKPKVQSEKLETFGALCNGVPGGGRKQAGGPPDWCQSSQLQS